jgi:hypothetical protein
MNQFCYLLFYFLYNFQTINAQITNSIQAIGININAVDHSQSHIFTVAIQKIPIVANAVIVPDIKADFLLFPNELIHNHMTNTRIIVSRKSHAHHINV